MLKNSNLFSRLISDDEEDEEELRMMTEERDKKQLAASLRANVQDTGVRCWSTEDNDIGSTIDQGRGSMAEIQNPTASSTLPQIADENDEEDRKCNECQFIDPSGMERLCNTCQKSYCDKHIVKGICIQCWGNDQAIRFLSSYAVDGGCTFEEMKRYHNEVTLPIESAETSCESSSRCLGCRGDPTNITSRTIQFPPDACGHRAHVNCVTRCRNKDSMTGQWIMMFECPCGKTCERTNAENFLVI